MKRCEKELIIEKYFGLDPEKTIETTEIKTDFGQLCGLLAMYAEKEEGSDFVPVKTDHGLFYTKIQNMFQGWQACFGIDHQEFSLSTNLHAFPEENTEDYAKWIEDNLVAALQRLTDKSNCGFLDWCFDNNYVKDEDDKLFWKAWVDKRKQTGLTSEQLYQIFKNTKIMNDSQKNSFSDNANPQKVIVAFTTNPIGGGTLGRSLELSELTNVTIHESGASYKFFTETVEVLIGVGKDHVARVIMEKDAWEAFKKGEELNIEEAAAPLFQLLEEAVNTGIALYNTGEATEQRMEWYKRLTSLTSEGLKLFPKKNVE